MDAFVFARAPGKKSGVEKRISPYKLRHAYTAAKRDSVQSFDSSPPIPKGQRSSGRAARSPIRCGIYQGLTICSAIAAARRFKPTS